MKRAQFVAIGIAKVREINLTGSALAHARRVFDRRAAIRYPGLMPCLGLFGIAHREANRAAIGSGGRLAVDGFGHHETRAIVRICQPAPGVLDSGLTTHRDEQGIVEFLRPSDVVTPDHDMAEHFVLSSLNSTYIICAGIGLKPTRSGLTRASLLASACKAYFCRALRAAYLAS